MASLEVSLRHSAANWMTSAAVVLVATLSVRAQYVYTITNIAGPYSGTDSFVEASAINNAGQVVGTSGLNSDDTTHRAFLYTVSGGRTDLGVLSGDNRSGARGINDAGQIVGWSQATGSGIARGFLVSGGSMSALGTLGSSNVNGNAINSSGMMVGYYDAAGKPRAFVCTTANPTSLTDLGTLGGDMANVAAVNSTGTIVGSSNLTNGGQYRAVSYNGATMTNLGLLNPGDTWSGTSGINASGVIVGTSGTVSLAHSFIYSGGSMTPIPDLGAYNYSSAYGINSSGLVVGEGQIDASIWHAFLYDGSATLDLNSLVDLSGSGFSYLSGANAINDLGQIVGYGFLSDGSSGAFLLTPIPEPSAYAMVLGLIGIGFAAWRRRRC